MKKIKLSSLVLVGLMFCLTACEKDNSTTKTTKLIKSDIGIVGSESEKLLVQTFANRYAMTSKLNISVIGGGSENGILALQKGECNIANSSRVLTDADYKQFKNDSVKQAIIAVDAIAIITHPTLGINELSLEQLSDIYSGKIKNWKELDGPDLAIIPVGRNPGSGTRTYIQHRFNLIEFASTIHEYKTYEEIINEVSNQKGAIGYISFQFIQDENLKELNNIRIMPVYFDANPPYVPLESDAITYGDYALIRPLFQYYIPDKENKVIKFIEFELSERGQQIARDLGFYPINDYHKQINRAKM